MAATRRCCKRYVCVRNAMPWSFSKVRPAQRRARLIGCISCYSFWQPNGEVVIRHPLKVAGKEGKDEDEDETDDDDLLAEGAMMAQGEKHGKAPEMLTFNGHT